MPDIRFENPETTEAFARLLTDSNVRLPLRLSDEDVGVVLDANGADVFTVDVNGERPNDEATAIAAWIMVAVNTCAGLKAEIQ